MKMKCGEHWHDASPTALLLFVEAMMEGDTVKINGGGITFQCVLTAITEERITSLKRRYKGNRIIVDGEIYDVMRKGKGDGESRVA